MNIKQQAMQFAIIAHSGQFRKAEKEKPTVFHAIDVANLLAKYGFDDNVIAAGYLHDVIEDTDYTKEDILEKFGEDICSLVVGASEADKTQSWEERKLGTINRVKTLDLRHKAIVACDKISNLEDLRYKFGRECKEDFSAFNRGKEKKLWYWQEVYKSLIQGEDINNPMFVKLKANLDNISKIFSSPNKEYYPDIDIINKKLEQSNIAKELHYKKIENLKLKSLLKLNNPYIIEIVNNSRKNNQDFIKKLESYFIISGYHVTYLKNQSDLEKIDNDNSDIIIVNNNNIKSKINSNLIINITDIFKKEKQTINQKHKNIINIYKKNNNELNSYLPLICNYILDDLKNKTIKKSKKQLTKIKKACNY